MNGKDRNGDPQSSPQGNPQTDEDRHEKLREAHREKVARNELRDSPLWAQPCRAYNVQVELDPRTRSSLGKIQQSLYQAEPNLLACPQQTLHVSIAWLLAVHASYPVPKNSLWERHGEEWISELDRRWGDPQRVRPPSL
jgi:hypothetical protein